MGIVTGELGAQVDQEPGPSTQQPVAAELASVQTARTTCWSITPWTANQASGPTS